MRFDFSDLRLVPSCSSGPGVSPPARGHQTCRSPPPAAASVEWRRRLARRLAGTCQARHNAYRGRPHTAQSRPCDPRPVGAYAGDLRGFATGLKGEIRLLSNTAALIDVIPKALRVFLEANPDVDIEIEERTSVEIVASLLAGHAEFGVIADSADHHGLEVRPLGIDRLTVIATARSALAARTTISFAELLEERFVGLTGGALTEHLSRNAANLGRRIPLSCAGAELRRHRGTRRRRNWRQYPALCRSGALSNAGVGHDPADG